MDNSVNSINVDKIEEKYVILSRNTGKKHILLGMDIYFIGGNEVTLTTPHHINETLEDFIETQKVNVANPETSQLFTIANEEK